MSDLEDRAFLWVVVVVSAAFAWILWPFFGTVLWATIAAILFAPLYRRLLPSMRQRRTPAALAAVTIITVMVILPLTVVTALLVQEASGVYGRIQSGDLNVGRYFRDVFSALPGWAITLLNRFGLMNLGDVQETLTTGLLRSSQFLAGQALNIGRHRLPRAVAHATFALSRVSRGINEPGVPDDADRVAVPTSARLQERHKQQEGASFFVVMSPSRSSKSRTRSR